MEKKLVKDTTKEDHYIEIAVGFKIIYNQNQYLAYTEVPKKKRDIRLEIYIGRVSLLKDQYLLFKCETDSERRQVFSYFKQVFSGEINDEIELVDFSMVERMSIVSSDLFEEKMDQYPNFFTLPAKEEEISANITLPSFLMKKTSKIKEQPEEIQFVKDNGAVLESNVEMPTATIETINQKEQTAEQVPNASIVSNSKVTPAESPVIQTPIKESPTVTQTITNTAAIQAPIESPTPMNNTPLKPTMEQTQPANLNQNAESARIPVIPNPAPITEVAQGNINITPPVEPTLNPEIPVEKPVKFEQIYDGKKGKKSKKGKTSIIVLMIITLLLIASIAVVYIFVVEPKMKEKPITPPVQEPEKPKTSNLVCTKGSTNEEDNSIENTRITLVYDNETKNILSSKEHTTVTMPNADSYAERKAMIKVFSQELKNTDGQKYSFKYDDNKYTYQVIIERNYEKATEMEKDDTWKSTFDEANEYYLEEGYTCNGIKKEPSNEKKLTGNNIEDYNNWAVTYKKAILSDDKETLSITLEVKNKATEARALNGDLKLFDKDNQNVRNVKLGDKIAPNETSMIVIEVKSINEKGDPELGSLEAIDLEMITQYQIELYR